MERSKPSSSPQSQANDIPSFPTVPSSVVHSTNLPTPPPPVVPSSPVPPLSLSSQRFEDLQRLGISNSAPFSLQPSSVSRSIPTMNNGGTLGINALPLHALSVDSSTNGVGLDSAYISNNPSPSNLLKFRSVSSMPPGESGKSLPSSMYNAPLYVNTNPKSPINALPVVSSMNNMVSPMGGVPNVSMRNNVDIGTLNNYGINPIISAPSGGVPYLVPQHPLSKGSPNVGNTTNGTVPVRMGIPYRTDMNIPEVRHHSSNPTSYDVRTSTGTVSPSLQVPLTVPVPYIFSSYLVSITVPSLELLESSIRTSLVSANIDHEYSSLKWKAKCYVYKAGGSVHFTLQTFNLNKSKNNCNTYLLELQRLRGSHVLFLDAYRRFIQVLESKNITTPLDENILAMVGGNGTSTAKKSSPISPSSPSSASVSPLAHPSSPLSMDGIKVPLSLTNFDADPDNDPIIKRLAEQQRLENAVPTVEESSAAIAAFAALSSMLTSEFEDIACPAAHSLSAMSLSQRMRTAIGTAALSGLDTWRNASAAEAAQARALPPTFPTYQNMPANMVGLSYAVPIAPPSGAVQLPPAPQTSSGVNSIAVAHLLERLIVRACMPNYHPSMPMNIPRASIESRTACAIALANLSLDESCCKVLGSLHIVPRLLYSSFVVPHGAASAAFRRHCMKAVANVLKINNEACKAAIPQMCLESIRRMPGYREYPIGDSQFDLYCNQIDTVLTSTVSFMNTNVAK